MPLCFKPENLSVKIQFHVLKPRQRLVAPGNEGALHMKSIARGYEPVGEMSRVWKLLLQGKLLLLQDGDLQE